MYILLGIDAVLRITAALLLLFVGVPALARRRPAELDAMQWFWWCGAAMIAGLTITGQLLTLLSLFNTLTLLLVIGAFVVIVRARSGGRRPAALLRDRYRDGVRLTLHTLEGRVNVRRRLRRGARHLRASLSASSPRRRWHVLAWSALILVAGALRFYRPFVTANLGFSDTYVHLYLMRLLEQGQQVDPAWGPYPRGMHFLLMAIHELTNVDVILLMNFFGPAAGVLMTLAVADAARRLSGHGLRQEGDPTHSRHFTAGIVAGALFATMLGGAGQYFLFGGSMATDRVREAREFVATPYEAIPPTRAEFDVLATVFQRQTATLPQELAIVFLFPAAMFLLSWLRRSQDDQGRWELSGYLFCTAAIAAVHPGVAVPLVVLSAVAVAATLAPWRDLGIAALTGAAGIVIGSTWMLGYIAYPYSGSPRNIVTANDAGSTAAYYFPFLRGGDDARVVTYVAFTPFLIACAVIAAVLLVLALARRVFRRPGPAEARPVFRLVWVALAALAFTLTHLSSRLGLPEIVEVRRNASWLAMAVAILLGVAIGEVLRSRVTKLAALVLALVWLWRVPVATAHERLIDYSGYSATAYAVLEIQRELEPFTWTLITYGQEFPMVLGRGFHLAAADFLDRYDPGDDRLTIPTPYVFIAVEKTPHPFEINTWAARFSRADIQRRLQTWCFLYQRTHRDMHIFRDDDHVRVYMIRRNVP